MNMQNNFKYTDDGSINLIGLVSIVKKRGKIIFFITMLSVLIGIILSYFVMTPIYKARTMLMVTQTRDMQQDEQQAVMNTFAGQIKSDLLLQRAINKLNLSKSNTSFAFKTDNSKYTPQDLSRHVRVVTLKDSKLIEITVSNGDPELAAIIANTISSEFKLLINEKNQEMINQSIEFFQSEISSLQNQLINASGEQEKNLLNDSIALLSDRTRITRAIDRGDTGILVVSPAINPVTPAEPDKALNIAVSLVAGLMISIILVFVIELLDNTITTPEDITKHLELPVLGLVLRPGRR